MAAVVVDEEFISRVLAGDRRSVAKALTLVEGKQTGWQVLLQATFPKAGRAFVVGLTGSPGAGKSTLVAALSQNLLRQGKKVAVLAVDPSSPFTGGALLGDRARLRGGEADPGFFFRSLASRGATGALSHALADCIQILDAAGWDLILVETVGAGQAEVAIRQQSDITLVVLTHDMGDEIQAAKAGILEIADAFVLNKHDLPGSERTLRFLRDEFPEKPIFPTVASQARGVEDLVLYLAEQNATRGRRKRQRIEERAENLIVQALQDWVTDNVRERARQLGYWQTGIERVRCGEQTVDRVAKELIAACLVHLITEKPGGDPDRGHKSDQITE